MCPNPHTFYHPHTSTLEPSRTRQHARKHTPPTKPLCTHINNAHNTYNSLTHNDAHSVRSGFDQEAAAGVPLESLRGLPSYGYESCVCRERIPPPYSKLNVSSTFIVWRRWLVCDGAALQGSFARTASRCTAAPLDLAEEPIGQKRLVVLCHLQRSHFDSECITTAGHPDFRPSCASSADRPKEGWSRPSLPRSSPANCGGRPCLCSCPECRRTGAKNSRRVGLKTGKGYCTFSVQSSVARACRLFRRRSLLSALLDASEQEAARTAGHGLASAEGSCLPRSPQHDHLEVLKSRIGR